MPTQSTNLTPLTGPGLSYTAIDQDWTIAPGVLVASNDDDGVHSSFSGTSLRNFGTVISGDGDDGVSFTSGGSVENGSTGFIIGNQFGIGVSGGAADDTSVVINAGIVQSSLYAIALTGQGTAFFSNSGTVSGLVAGAYVLMGDGARIVNSGTIEGNYIGLGAVTISEDQKIEIINSGTIKVGYLIPDIETGALFAGGSNGGVDLQNTGTIIGRVALEGGTSGATVKNSGLIDGEIALGLGADTFDGKKGTQGAVHGGNGDDTIIGGVGVDALYGELGNDVLTGGKDADAFWFTTEPNSKSNRDMVTDFSHEEGDQIVLDRDIFTGLGDVTHKLKGKYFEVGKKPENKNDKIVYNEKSGVLIYAENGSKTDKADWLKFAQLDKGTELDHKDFLLV